MVLRVFRLARLFRIFRKFESVHLIFTAFLNSLPALINVGGLLLLLFFIYSILTMNYFAEVQLNGELVENLNF